MSDTQQEREHLALADRHIAEGEMRVAEQIALIERMSQQGLDITLAEEFLRSLEQFRNHRQLILDAMGQG